MPHNHDIFKKYINYYFVESGTYFGGGIETAHNAGYKDIRSIELSPELYHKTSKRFIKSPHIKMYLGDSGKMLYDIIKDIDGEITFFLDGHYSEGCTALGNKYSPLLEELDQIGMHKIKKHTIIVDDINNFQTHDKNYGFNLFDLIKKVKKINENYEYILHEEQNMVVFKIKDK